MVLSIVKYFNNDVLNAKKSSDDEGIFATYMDGATREPGTANHGLQTTDNEKCGHQKSCEKKKNNREDNLHKFTEDSRKFDSYFAEKYGEKKFKYYNEENYAPHRDANKKHHYYLQVSKHFADQSSVECAKHSALLVHDNQIIAIGINRYILSKFNSANSHLYFKNNIEYKSKYKVNKHFDAFTIHAEIDVFVKAYSRIPKHILKNMPLSLYVVRSQNNDLTLSKPCDRCQKFLKQFKNLKIYFSL